MRKSRNKVSTAEGRKFGLRTVLLGAGCMIALLGTAASAGKDREYEEPEIVCPQEDGAGGWYQTKPEVKIIHTDPNAVTRYSVETGTGKLLEGELRLEKKEDPEKEEDLEKKEDPGRKKDTGAPAEQEKTREEQEEGGAGKSEGEKENSKEQEEEENGKPEEQDHEEDRGPEDEADSQKKGEAVEELPAEIWEEGENRLTVWMETPDGKKEIYRSEKAILLDQSDPGPVSFSYPSHPEAAGLYFQHGAEITMDCEDQVSGVCAIICILADGTEKRMEGGHTSLALPAGYAGSITAYAEDWAGRTGERSVSQTVVCEDEPPAVLLSVPGGFESWHRGLPEITISVRELGEKYGFSSGLASVTCHAAGKTIVQKSYLREWAETGKMITEEEISFTVEEASEGGKPVSVTVFAADRAGNTAVRTETLYIDLAAPDVRIKGIEDGMITGEAAKAEFAVTDDNILEDVQLAIWQNDVNGSRTEAVNPQSVVWEGSGADRTFTITLEEDGVYEFAVSASDRAGYRTEKKGTFTIDRTSPVIRYVDQLNGAYMRFFQWNYGREEMIRDFTDYSYQMYLDGRPYLSGRMETEEGVHLLEVKAEDAAGNRSRAKAVFTIDHTPPEIHLGEVKDGSVYEESVLLSLWVDGEGERLKWLMINGEKQELSAGSRIFQYKITEPGRYMVEVKADDLTGNEAEERVVFEVKEREGLAEKILRPVGRVLLRKGKSEEEQGSGTAAALLAAAGCAAVLCAVAGRVIHRKRRR